MTLTIWHNPRCSKSRETLALLQARGDVLQVRLYLTDPPDFAELTSALARLGQPAFALARTGEPDFRALSLPRNADDPTILRALAAHPHLIERPLVLTRDKAAIGRPPEAVLAIL